MSLACVKNVRLTTTVVCALYLKIQEVRGSSSYMGMALRCSHTIKLTTGHAYQACTCHTLQATATATLVPDPPLTS